MAEIVRMPKLSDTMTDGVIAKWHKKVGDKVKSGELLADIRNVANQFAPPADACGSYTALYERLDRVTADTHLHVHIENNVLFPMAVAAEAAAAHVAG